MKREFLAELKIDDEIVDQIMAEHGKTVNPLKEERDSIYNERDNLQTQLSERDTQLDELSQKANNHDELKQQIEGLKDANEQAKQNYQEKLRKQTLDYSLEKSLINAGARNPITVKALLDNDVIKLSDSGELIGLSEQLDRLKESDGYLFKENEEESNKNQSHVNRHIPGSEKKSNKPKDIDAYELGKQIALERFKKEEVK